MAYRRCPYIVAENVACNPALDLGLSPLRGSTRDRWHVPVANDSCGGAAAVVNYRNWPLIGLAVPSGVSVRAVETTRVGRQRKK